MKTVHHAIPLFCFVCFCLSSFFFFSPEKGACADWDIVLLITADTGGALLPVAAESNARGGEDAGEIGGFARLAGAMEAVRVRNPGKTLTVSAGEDLMGRFYREADEGAVFRVMSEMGYAVGTLGNHEFDKGEAFLANALDQCAFPLVETNLVLDDQSLLRGRFLPWKLLERNGFKIGFFGLISSDMPVKSKPGPNVSVSRDYAGEAERAARALREKGADLVVALVQIGMRDAQVLASAVPDIDVVCAGDSDLAVAHGRELLPRDGGRITVVTQTGRRGAYLGMLKLKVGDKRIQDYFWRLIRMDTRIPEDPETRKLVLEYAEKLPKDAVAARTPLPLDTRKRTLRKVEAPMGNFLCDALRSRFGVDVALYNGGGIRGDRIIPKGNILDSDIRKMFPFGSDIHILRVPGRVLQQALERSVSSLPEAEGHFLQVSGLRFLVDLSARPAEYELSESGEVVGVPTPGERVGNIVVEGDDGSFLSLDPNASYTVATSSYLSGGGDGYTMFKHLPKRNTGRKTVDVMLERFHRSGGAAPFVDGRIAMGKP